MQRSLENLLVFFSKIQQKSDLKLKYVIFLVSFI